MSNDGGVLPQDEIDSLFKRATGKEIKPPAAAVSPIISSIPQLPDEPAIAGMKQSPTEASVTTPGPEASNETMKTTQVTMADLARRMAKLEASISQLIQKEKEAPGVKSNVQRLSQRLEAVVKNLQKLNSQVGGVMRGLEGTPAYNMRKDFTCTSCGSHGFVVIPTRCANCGREGWRGWWPKKK